MAINEYKRYNLTCDDCGGIFAYDGEIHSADSLIDLAERDDWEKIDMGWVCPSCNPNY